MRKKAILISLISIFSVFLFAIIITAVVLFSPCKHRWINANCTVAKTCSICNATEGETGNHNWKKATCRSPKKCTVCGKTEGSASKHYYIVNNDFGGYRVCAYCNEYEPNVHCSDCGWSTFTTGVGTEGITCPDCGNKVI